MNLVDDRVHRQSQFIHTFDAQLEMVAAAHMFLAFIAAIAVQVAGRYDE